MSNLSDEMKQFGATSLEDARKLAELTGRIVANQKAIEENDIDLDALLEQTSAVVANYRFIDESNVNLNDLLEQTNIIVANLKVVGEEA